MLLKNHAQQPVILKAVIDFFFPSLSLDLSVAVNSFFPLALTLLARSCFFPHPTPKSCHQFLLGSVTVLLYSSLKWETGIYSTLGDCSKKALCCHSIPSPVSHPSPQSSSTVHRRWHRLFSAVCVPALHPVQMNTCESNHHLPANISR